MRKKELPINKINIADVKNTIRAIFFDLDGTLLSFATGRVPQSALNALQLAHRKGYLLFAATGRDPREMADAADIDQIPFSGFVTVNGQFCTVDGEVIHSLPLPQKDLEQLAGHLRETDAAAHFSTKDGTFANRLNDILISVNQSLGIAIPPVRPLEEILTQPVYQVSLFVKERTAPPILDEMTGCFYTFWNKSGLDICAKGGGKWAGILAMARHFGISPGQIMAVGDNNNDVDMLQNAAFSVALGDGSETARQAADYVTKPVDEDGIAHAFRELFGLEV